MNKKAKRIPVNSVGKLIKEAREKKELSIEDLVWQINKPKKVTAELIKKWEKGQKFPDLDCIYLLAENLDLNPNELLNKRLTIQDESIHEVDWAERRVGGKIFNAFYVVVRQAVKWIAGICIIVVVANYKNFENKMTGENDPEQIELIESVIDNAVKEFTTYDYTNTNTDIENTNVENNTILDNNVIVSENIVLQ